MGSVELSTGLCSRIEGVKQAVSFTNLEGFFVFSILLDIDKDGE